MDMAAKIVSSFGTPHLKLMIDCYHVARMGGDIIQVLTNVLPLIGHIQFAGVPHRGKPTEGDVDYKKIFNHLTQLGYDHPLGAEYRPEGKTDDSLDWMSVLG